MKNLLVLSLSILALSSASAFAGDSMVCKGIQGSEGNTLHVTILDGRMSEGEKFPVHIVIENEDGVDFDAKGWGEMEDVNFTFKSRTMSGAGEKLFLQGHIYLDELDQTSVSLNDYKYRFDCAYIE